MLFYEPLFLFVFFPTLYALFWIFHRMPPVRMGIVLAASIIFYLWSEPVFVPVVLLSCALDHALGRAIADARDRPRLAGLLVAIGVIANLGILVHYKYTNFLVDNLNALLAPASIRPFTIAHIALPVGVSFIVFEKITYLVDIRRGLSRPAPSFPTYLLYVFLFPKLLAGPIIKYHELESQLRDATRVTFDDAATGFLRFMLGVAKKTLLADTLGAGADMIFGANPGTIGFADAWWGVVFFTLQIYFDFSAYSDMAIGLARMLGFRLNENFNMPYISCSITEFWRRWHISLSTWIREYLYIPLGGNRVSPARRYLNLWLCFLASGLWHGAAWTYILWGAYNGVFLVLDKLFLLRVLGRMPAWAANLFTFAVTMIGWTIFRATSLGQAGAFYHAMFHPGLAGHSDTIYLTDDMITAAVVGGIICAIPRLPFYARISDWMMRADLRQAALQTGIALLFVCAVGKAVADPFRPFLYFRF